ncbi:TPA: hypothetical protein R4104_001500 [Enterobacter asburiae]|uniref:DUF7940 domain-containing protein n=1 Tax=Enterobacter asburiae TaxID=61645 RepID=UPI00265D6BE5|nr:hypothetical protein [Enterobacter asburiae]HCM9127857.1 hypothetical protein [Enterobacter asburiae]HED1589932.1 hypothetical protein [Enterobacter asburiae]HED2713882.1 hypothetical protein [Enterobacter asburiae]HED3276640.1 hypothetical protein [Enterobacter asburiae]
MKFIDNLPQLWKMWSVRILAVLAVIAGIWDQVPDDVKALIPAQCLGYIVAFVSVCGIIARAIKQFDNDQPK